MYSSINETFGTAENGLILRKGKFKTQMSMRIFSKSEEILHRCRFKMAAANLTRAMFETVLFDIFIANWCI